MISGFGGISPFSRPHFVPGGGGGIVLVDWAVSSGGSDSTAAIDTTGANLLVAFDGVLFTTTSITDTYGNTWLSLTPQSQGSFTAQLFYCANPIVGPGHVAMGQSGVAGGVGMVAVKMANISPFGSENGAGASSTSLQPGSVTPSADGSLIVTAIQNTFNGPPSCDSGFTFAAITNTASYGFGFLIQSVAAPINPTWSWGSSGAASAVIATFKP